MTVQENSLGVKGSYILSEADRATAVAEYVRGRSSRTVAEDYGVNPLTIINYVREAGYEVRQPGYSSRVCDKIIDLAQKMRAEGIPWKRVVAHIGYGKTTLQRKIKERENAST